jgi:CheY-like chemotaxis protein
VLVHVGQVVFLAADGVEAVDLARQFKARLVLLDIAMPKLNGLLACDAIRSLPGYANVPIVMLTGYDDERMRHAARRVGANDFITKPFRPDQLLERLAGYLGIPAPAGRAPVNPTGAPPPLRRAQVWVEKKATGQGSDSDVRYQNGREIMRIFRGSERKT